MKRSRLLASAILFALAFVACRARRDEDVDDPPHRVPLARHDCTVILGRASRRLGAAVSAANPARGGGCAVDADCVEVAAASCVTVCSGNAVPRAAAASFGEAMGALETTDCWQWKAGGCPAVMPPAPGGCRPSAARCVRSTCQMVEP